MTELLIPNGGWRWHYDAARRLRREERLGTKEVVDYWDIRPHTAAIARPPVPRGYASKEFMPAGPAPGTMVPEWSAKTLAGATISSETLRGRVVIVDFWATWCGPCRASMPHLQKLYDQHHARGLEVVGVTWRESADPAKYAEKNAIRYPITTTGNAAAGFGTDEYGIPLLYVIGRDGRVIDFTVGYSGERTDQWLRETVEKALASMATNGRVSKTAVAAFFESRAR